MATQCDGWTIPYISIATSIPTYLPLNLASSVAKLTSLLTMSAIIKPSRVPWCHFRYGTERRERKIKEKPQKCSRMVK